MYSTQATTLFSYSNLMLQSNIILNRITLHFNRPVVIAGNVWKGVFFGGYLKISPAWTVQLLPNAVYRLRVTVKDVYENNDIY